MVYTLADGVDAGIVSLQGIVDHDAARAVQASGFREGGVWSNANGHHHQCGRQYAAIRELHAGHLLIFITQNGCGTGTHDERDAALLQGALQQPPGGRIELALHQGLHQVHDGDGHPACFEAVGCFQA